MGSLSASDLSVPTDPFGDSSSGTSGSVSTLFSPQVGEGDVTEDGGKGERRGRPYTLVKITRIFIGKRNPPTLFVRRLTPGRPRADGRPQGRWYEGSRPQRVEERGSRHETICIYTGTGRERVLTVSRTLVGEGRRSHCPRLVSRVVCRTSSRAPVEWSSSSTPTPRRAREVGP